MSIFKNRNFTILFSGQLVSSIGDNLYSIALLWYVLDLTHSKGDLAVTGFATTLPPLLGAFIGVYVDRWRKQTTMIASDIARAGLLLLLYLITTMNTPHFAWIVAVVVAVELAGTFFSPAFSSLLPYIVSQDEMAAASGINMSGSAFASLGGMIGGGALLAFIGATRLFLGDALSFIASVVSLTFVRSPEVKRTRTADTNVIKEWKTGMRIILKSRYLTQSGLTSMVNNFSLSAFGIVITPWVKDTLHGSALVLGMIYGALLVGMILGGLLAGHAGRRFRYRMIDFVTLVGLGLGVSLAGVWANVYWDAGVLFVAGLMLGVVDGMGGAVRVLMIPEDVRGRVYSTLSTASRMAMPLGVAVLGSLLLYLPTGDVLMLTGVSPIIGGLSYLLPFSKRAFAEIDANRSLGRVVPERGEVM
ncbi:MFS transporter [Alicyclobacillus sp. ALC3]|uniref:MFS transporter n=1 Tax=Alicyclobacillus sp. ALC3 TaxID=2796143 RepID=UPI0023795967|nr:MFS transporter [Alicyclobacillus sp. ALC3]WDL99123.1 MFS transporter [Alicyclobacillus sp. ALC3]